ncbi:MAG: phenylacetate--CoA ligase family protein, partial [Pseudomonadota bacterium]
MNEFSDQKEWMPVEERERYVVDKFREVAIHAYENAPAMKKRFDEAGVDLSKIKSINDLEKIPIVTRDEFIEMQRKNPPFGGFLTVHHKELKRIYIHPGPQYETLADADIEHGLKALWKIGVRKDDIVINALSYHLVAAGLLLDDLITIMGATVVPTGVGNTDLQVQIMHDLGATYFVGFPLFLLNIIRRAEEMGYDFKRDFVLKKALALGTSPVRKILEEDYTIDTRELYAFLPVGLAASECDEKSGMHIEEDFIVEIVDPLTGKQLPCGEVGEIIVTTLFNDILPRIRFGSGDLAYCTDEPCPCGRTSIRLVKVVGRVGEAVKTRGMFIHPLEAEDVVSKLSGVSKFQILVSHHKMRDFITAKVELTNETVDKEKLS